MASERVSAPSERVSPRVELARVALAAALGVDGVVAGNAGEAGILVTQDGARRLPGVVATAEGGGCYGVELYLTAALVPLHELGERVAEQVRKDVGDAGLAERLGALHVTIADIEGGPRT